MDMPGADFIMESVRKINQMSQRARAGEPGIEEYLQMVSSDPTTQWFTELLREKNDELLKEKDRSARLAHALRAWCQNREDDHDADFALIKTLSELGIIGH